MYKILSATIALTLLVSSSPAYALTDSNLPIDLQLYDIKYHRNKKAIEYLYNQGIVTGYEDNTFRPDNTINRAELLKILVGDKVANIEHVDEWGTPHPDYLNCFSDVNEEWFAVYVCMAKKEGWISGYPDGSFRPAQAVNKAEAIKMLINIEGIAPSENPTSIPYDDVEADAWYIPFVIAANERGLLEVDRGNFEAGRDMTRGSISESMYRVAMMKISGNDKYVKEGQQPTIKQVQGGNLYPINLEQNQKWQIEVWRDDEYFVVKRDEDSFAVQAYTIDDATGNIKKPYRGDEYRAEFERYSTMEGMALSIQECHFRYEYIMEDARCDTILLPVDITQQTVHGYSAQFTDDVGQDYKVKIVSKAQEEVPCTVRAQTYDGELIYYTADSEAMIKDGFRGVYKCFASEEDAQRHGYRKSYK